MKIFTLISIFFISFSAVAHEDWSLKSFTVDKTLGAPFVRHETTDPYLAMNLKYESFKEFLEKVDRFAYRPVHGPNEAHITIITADEFQNDLSKFLTIKEISEISEKLNLQQSTYNPICMGKGSLLEKEKYLETYFIVVESENFLNIRKQIAELYKKRGGNKFDPLHYYPHITLGFTDRDLDEKDGLIKDSKACMKTLHISPKPSTVKGLPIPNSYFIEKNKKGGAIIRGSAPLNHHNLELMKKFGISEYIIFKNDKAGEVKGEIGGLLELGVRKDSVTHIDFDWKDNENFNSGCQKLIQGINLLKLAMKNNKKIYFHCTTGEDRSGVLAASYLLAVDRKTNIKKLFKNEMCAKGYEAGDPEKDKDVVARIRAGLTVTFLKMAYRIDQAKKEKHPINENICSTDPEAEADYIKYSKQMNFTCGVKATL